MSLPYPAPAFADADYTHAAPCSLPVFSAPLPNTSTQYLLTQKFRIYQNNFSALPLNTLHPDYPTFVLVNESNQQDMAGGVVEWTRTYAAVPASYSEFETFTASFIGLTFSTSGGPAQWPTIFTRSPFTRRVQSRIQYDFFICSATINASSVPNPYDGGGSTFAVATPSGTGAVNSPIDVPGNIPFVFEMLYLSQAYLNPGPIWWGGLGWTAAFLGPTTMPTLQTYVQKCLNDAAKNGWNATLTQQYLTAINPAQYILNPTAVNPPDAPSPGQPNTPTPNSVYGGQLPAEDSQLSRWQGNIYVRKTRYILAE